MHSEVRELYMRNHTKCSLGEVDCKHMSINCTIIIQNVYKSQLVEDIISVSLSE